MATAPAMDLNSAARTPTLARTLAQRFGAPSMAWLRTNGSSRITLSQRQPYLRRECHVSERGSGCIVIPRI
jgi:hypothetical protein